MSLIVVDFILSPALPAWGDDGADPNFRRLGVQDVFIAWMLIAHVHSLLVGTPLERRVQAEFWPRDLR